MHDFAPERIYEANVAIHVCTDKWMRVVAERSHSMSDPPNITSNTSSGTLRITMHLKPQAQTWQVAGIQKEVIQATMKQ